MVVIALRQFFDLDANVMRGEGESFEATEERVQAINSTRYGTLVTKAPAKAEKPARPQRGRRRAKAKE